MAEGAPYTNTDRSKHTTRQTNVHGAGANKLMNTGDLDWVREFHTSPYGISVGATGAQLTEPDGSTMGGYQLDASTEKIYMDFHIHEDWNGESDLTLEVEFEVNLDNSGGLVTDTVDLQAVLYAKADGEAVPRSVTAETPVTVGQCAQYTRFTCELALPYDTVDNELAAGDCLTIVLNLETDTSEVDDIIVNHITLHYHQTIPTVS